MALTKAYRGGDSQGRPGFWFAFKFDQDTIDALKGIPPQFRSYNEESREWWVADEPSAIAKVERLFPAFHTYVDAPSLPGFE